MVRGVPRHVCFGLRRFDVGDETVALFGKRFYKARRRGRITENVSDSVYGIIKSMIEVYKGFFRPKRISEIFTSYELTRPRDEHYENLSGLSGKSQLEATFAQFTRLKIQTKLAKRNAILEICC